MKRFKGLIKLGERILKSSFFEYAILGIILVAAFGVRFYKIDNPVADWHAWRQADTVSVSRIFLDQGIDLLHPRYYDVSPIQTGSFNPKGLRFVEFPVYNALNVWAYKLVGHFSLETWARLISVLCALGSTFFLYLIGKKLINRWGGLITAFFYAFIPYNIYFTRVILPEPMAVLFTVASIWFFMVFVDKKSRLGLFLSALFLALAMLLKPFVIFYFPVYLYLLVKKFGWRVFWTRIDIYVALLIVAAPFCLWRGWMNQPQNAVGIPLFEWLFNGNGIRLHPAWWRWIFGERLGYLILGIWGLPLFAFGVLKRKNLPILMVALGMFLYVLVLADGNVQHDYYQTQTIPAIALMLASGAVYLWNNLDLNKWIVRGFLVFCVGMMLGMGWYQIKGDYQVNHYELVVAGQEADKILPMNAIVIAPYNADTTFLYQTHRFGWPIVDRSIEEMIFYGADYYVSVNFDNDTNNFIKKFKTVERTDTFIILDLHQPLQSPAKK